MKIRHIKENNGFVFERKALKPGQKVGVHWHNNIEILYVEKGCIRLSIRKRTFDVRAGDIAVVHNCDHHAYSDGYKRIEDKTVLQIISVSPEMVSSVSKLKKGCSFIAQKAEIDSLGLRDFIDTAMKGIESEERNRSDYSDALINSYVIQLYLNLQKTYSDKEDLGTTVDAEYERLFPDFKYNYENSAFSDKTMSKFQLVLDYIDRNFSDTGLSLGVLAEVSGLSDCYISELFPLIIGIKFKNYLNTLRINYALRLLSMSDINISQAAYESGFETIRTFNSVFKRLKGVTPSEYINGLRDTGDSGKSITTKITCMNLSDENVLKKVFGINCDIKEMKNPENENETVFGIITDKKNKVWTSFNINMLFKAGQKYKVLFDVHFLPDVNGNTSDKSFIGVNMFYAEGEGEARAHSYSGVTGGVKDGWLHYENEYSVSPEYIPGLYDKFSIYAHPVNDVGMNFLIKNISCYPV